MFKLKFFVVTIFFLFFLSACGLPDESGTAINEGQAAQSSSQSTKTAVPADEILAAEPTNQDFSKLSQFMQPDAILPIYNPEFLPGNQVKDLPPEALILGVAWEGEAKAYPIKVLQFREMVEDELAGIPILATW